MTKRSPVASGVGAGQYAAGRAGSDRLVRAGRRIGWMSGIRMPIRDLGDELIGRR